MQPWRRGDAYFRLRNSDELFAFCFSCKGKIVGRNLLPKFMAAGSSSPHYLNYEFRLLFEVPRCPAFATYLKFKILLEGFTVRVVGLTAASLQVGLGGLEESQRTLRACVDRQALRFRPGQDEGRGDFTIDWIRDECRSIRCTVCIGC